MRHADEARRSHDSLGSRIAVGLVAALAALALVAATARAADHSWSGVGTAPGSWSNAANWSAGLPPASGETIGTLTFPALTDPACGSDPPAAACGSSTNDLTGITVGTLAINDAHVSSPGAAYDIVGNGITLTGGLTASPGAVASSGFFQSTLGVPITLGARQTWTVAGNPPILGQVHWGEGLLISAPVTGSAYGLTIRMSNGATLLLSGDNEVGPLSVVGSNPAGSGPFVSTVLLAPTSGATPTRLNATDGQPVAITDAQLVVDGELGPVRLTRGSLDIGGSPTRAGIATAPAVRFDARSDAVFNVHIGGSAAGADYAQLRSTGLVSLGGARLVIVAGGPSPTTCRAPATGTVYTLVRTTGQLTGRFDVPQGNVVSAFGPPPCPQRLPVFALRIEYHESGSPQTVTGTVVPVPPPGVGPGVAGAAPVSGTVLVRRRGQTAFRVLKRDALLPAGSELDTTRGRVRLFVATDQRGGTTSAELYTGRFVFRQTGGARLRTRFTLSQPLDGCRRARSGAADASRRRHRHRARHVWVTEDGGSFDTRAQYVGTSVQGTTWLTGDTCTTSVVKVKEGTVTVRDLVRHRTVGLHAGQSYTARKRG
jgi:hypothetical protein